MMATKKDDSKKNTIVMITDKGTIEDKSFNQGTWEGIKAYGTETGAKTEYIKPTDGTTQAYNEAIDQAVNDYKANVVVTQVIYLKHLFMKNKLHILM